MNMTSADRSDPLRQSACARLAEVAVAATAHLPAEILRTPGRGHPRVALARQTAMYLAHVAFGLTLSRVGICFGRDRTTVRHACARIEDGRDDPTQELALSALEAGLLALTTALGAVPKEEVHP
jgi:chromosomal replication initiation ATPase DnaA